MRAKKLNTQVSLGWLLYATSFLGLFFCSFYSGTTFVAYGSINALWKMMRVYALVAIGFKCAYIDHYKLKELLVCVISAILAFIVFVQSDRGTVLEVIILIIGARGISYKKILNLYLKAASILLLVTMLASTTGIIIDYTTVRNFGGVQIGSRLRHSFGINYATDFAAHVFFLYLTYRVLAFARRKMKTTDLVFTLVVIALLEYYCNARLSEILMGATSLLFWIFERKQKLFQSRLIKKSIVISYIVCAMISIVTVLLYDPLKSKWVFIDEMFFSKRLKISHNVLEQNGIKLFGQYIFMQGQGYKVNGFDTSIGTTYLDSSYVQLLLLYGIIMTVFTIAVMTAFSRRTVRDNNIALGIAAVVLAVSCVINQYLLHIAYNPFIIVAGACVFGAPNSLKDTRGLKYDGQRQ